MQLRRNAGPLQREVHQHAVLRRADDVVAAVREEDRWRPAWNADTRSEFVLVLRLEVTRIDRNGEVGSATDFVHVIDRLVSSLVEARRRRNRQMTARRKTDDADSADAPFPGFAPHQTDGPLGVLEGATSGFTLGLIGTSRHPVLEDDPGHTKRVQPFSDFLAFELPVEIPIAATGTNQHGCPAVLFLRGPIDREGRFSDVGYHPGRLGDLDLFAVELW